ncbi:MAG: YchJ family protein [Aeromonas sp.]
MTPCPCTSGQPYAACCAPHHQGAPALTCEALMRSRFSAFTLGLGEYLLRTWDAASRQAYRAEELAVADPGWLRLDVLAAHGAEADAEGEVTFKAWHLAGGQLECLHERSRFVREAGGWVYASGEMLPTNGPWRLARNAPCPCGSGKKSKKCCFGAVI